jgi:hypothetical protein
MNDSCYRLHAINFTEGVLDDCIDATYIIHLEGNGRLEHIYEQLNTFHPSKKIFILFNKGFKRCSKQKYVDKPPIDLIDAFLTVIQDAQNKKFHNILILEDDFIFHNDFLEPSHNKHIIQFVNNNKEKEIVYLLGCLPYLQIPYYYYNRRILWKSGTHACIYSKNMCKTILQKNKEDIHDCWDVFTNMHCQQYMYYKPLCYQLFTNTENKKYWLYLPLLSDLNEFFKKVFLLDKQVEPGYTYYYWFSFLFLFFIIFIVITVFVIINKRNILYMFVNKK